MSANRHDHTTKEPPYPLWDFNAQMRGPVVPWTIMLRRELAPGARLLWSMLRVLSYKSHFCDAREALLAKRLGVTTRQIRRYMHQLERVGLIWTQIRPGATARRFLTLHPWLSGAIVVTPDGNVQGVGPKGPGEWTDRSTIIKESKNIPVQERSIKVPSTSRRSSNGMLKPAGTLLDGFCFSEGEDKALKREITALGFQATPELMEKLRRKVDHHGANGFVAAAEIARAAKLTMKRPENRPTKEGWFTTVLETALAARAGADRSKR